MATHPDASPPQPKVLGSYVIQQRIAVGGMSEVYLAGAPQRAGADRTVVIKRMLPRVAEDPALRRMFGDEAALGSRIKHPNVVNVIGLIDSEDDYPALAMEYVRGVDLWRLGRWLIRSGQRLEPELAVFVASEMLRGLQAVHEACDEAGRPLGVVHRDVSPSNVLVSIHGDVKLGDLGIAQAAARERYPSGEGARAKGKLGYLAPEQVRGRSLDCRSDLFSAAVVTAELLMGKPLFAGGSELAVLLAIRDSKIHPFVEFCETSLPEGIGEVVQQALAAEPEERPESAGAMADRLGAFIFAPRTDLQAQLAEHVWAAMADAAQTGDIQAPGSPTNALPFDPEQHSRPTFVNPTPSAAPASATAQEETRTQSGARDDGRKYTFTTVGGEQLGPWSFAQAVEAVSTGHLGPFDRVTGDGQPEALLSDVPELARHVPVSTMTTAQGSDAQLQSGAVMPVEGGGIVAVLANAAVEQFSGLLLCERGEVRKEVYLDRGRPTFVTSNQSSELLGEHLVSRGVITRAELDEALAVMPRFEGRLGDTLAGLRLVEPVTLFRHIAEQIREKLLGLFLWPTGSCTQYVGVASPPSSFPLQLRPWDVIDEGLTWRLMRGMDDRLLKRAAHDAVHVVEGPRTSIWLAEMPLEAGRVYRAFEASPRVPASIWKDVEEMDGRLKMQRAFVLLMHVGALQWEG